MEALTDSVCLLHKICRIDPKIDECLYHALLQLITHKTTKGYALLSG